MEKNKNIFTVIEEYAEAQKKKEQYQKWRDTYDVFRGRGAVLQRFSNNTQTWDK